MTKKQEKPLPVPGFSWMGINVGIKDDSLDFGVLFSEKPCSAAAVFTRNNLPGAPVIVGREHVSNGLLQSVVVNSKCANVGLGEKGLNDAHKMSRLTAEALDLIPELVLPSSTGVIGVPLNMDCIHEGTSRLPEGLSTSPSSIEAFARAIMTTDTYPKWRNTQTGNSSILGIAKGSAMIEPNMATMLCYIVSNASIESPQLQLILKRAVDASFNRISIDSDTSTSDTVVILANGEAGPVNLKEFELALTGICQELAKDLVRDGEGVSKLMEVRVSGAESAHMALSIGKSIINSPLIKTAVHGADPNWGRFVMAVGKVFDYPVRLEDLLLKFGKGIEEHLVSAQLLSEGKVDLESIQNLFKKGIVQIEVIVGQGSFSEVVWGCDLSKDYIDENAFYTS